jgi:ankyrin repeat protein
MGRSALLHALDKGHAGIVDHLLDREQTNINVADILGNTPLLLA